MTLQCLVVQLGSLESTLQAIAALKAAKEQYSGLRLHVVALSENSEVWRRISWIEQVIPFPADDLVGSVVSGQLREKQALGNLAKWVAPLVQFRWDMVVNWTYSDASSHLAALLPAKVKLGYTRRKDGSFSAPDGWSRYFQAIIQGDLAQNVHVTDVLSTQLLTALQIHCGTPEAPQHSLGVFSADVARESQSLSRLAESPWAARDRSRKWVAIQLRSQSSGKGWGTENWGKLAARILKRHSNHSLVLLGQERERKQARHLLSTIRRQGQDPDCVMNLVGETDFNHWTAVLGGVSWVLSEPGPSTHLASLLGTRALTVVPGSLRLAFGPYGNGHYIIAPRQDIIAPRQETVDEQVRRRALTPEGVYATWSYASSEWSHLRKTGIDEHFSRIGASQCLAGISIYRSRIRRIDEGGGVDFEAMGTAPTSVTDWTAMVLEYLARELYCGWTPEIPSQLSRLRMGTDLLRALRETREMAMALSKIAKKAAHTALLLSEKSAELKSENIMTLEERLGLQELSSTLGHLEDLIRELPSGQPTIRAVARLHQVMMHNLSGVQLAEVSAHAHDWYTQLSMTAERITDWADRSLEFAKPVAVAEDRSARAKGAVPVHLVE